MCSLFLDHTLCDITFNVWLQAIPACSLDLTGLDLRLYGAQLAEKVNETVTHIVFDKK